MELPKGHEEIGSAEAGKEYGHVPGHQYHDVRVVISRRGSFFRCLVRETWGASQGRPQEHGRTEAIGRGGSIHEACRQAERHAGKIGIRTDYLTRAMSAAEDEALLRRAAAVLAKAEELAAE